MSTTHIVRYIPTTLSAANKQGTSTTVTVSTDFAGNDEEVTVRSGDVVAEAVSAQNDENGFPLLMTLSLWQVNASGRPWSLLPKPKVGDLVFQVGEGNGLLNGTGGVVTESGFLRFDANLSTFLGTVSALSDVISALDLRITTLEEA